jgi:uncharacterized protein (DUF2147 family)
MKRLFALAAMLALPLGPALAADPTPIGDWLVKDGYGVIRIDNCAGKMWGIVAWEKLAGIDKENPDPAKRTRPTLGVPIITGMAPTKPNKWEGEIYNTENGKMYSGSISMIDENALQLEGCLFPNFLCGGQKWTRITSLPTDGVSVPPPAKGAPTRATVPAAAKKGAAPAAQLSDVCTRVAAEEAAAAAKGTAKK